MSKRKDLISIGEAYGDMLNKVVVENKTVPVGEIGNADLVTKDTGPTERGGFKPAAIDIDRMTDKEKDENLYNIKGLTYGDDNDPGIGNQQPLPTGPEFGQVSYTGNVGGPEEDNESEDREGGILSKIEQDISNGMTAKESMDSLGIHSSRQKDMLRKYLADTKEYSEGPIETGFEDEEDASYSEEDEEILSEHEKNARRSLNNFMAKQSVFDKLYNKVMVSEEFEEEFSETEDLEALGVTEEEPEDITVTIPSDLAQTLCDILKAALEEQEIDVETEVDVSETETVDFAEEDEEAAMKDGGGYGVDAGSTLNKEVDYALKNNKVGNLKTTGAARQKDGGGYGVDAGSTLHHTVDHALKNNKVGKLPVGKNAFGN